MFFRFCSPRSVNSTGTLPRTCSYAEDADATRLSDPLKPRRNIDPVTKNVVAFYQDIAEIDPDPKQHTLVLWDTLVPLGHHRLHRHSAFNRIDDRGKLEQHAVPPGLHEATPVFRHEGVGNLAVFAECAGGADLIEAHKPRVTSHVSGDYGRQSASDPTWLLLFHTNHAPLCVTLCLPDFTYGGQSGAGEPVASTKDIGPTGPLCPPGKRSGARSARPTVFRGALHVALGPLSPHVLAGHLLR